jgi:hypothetical protein
VDNDSASSIIRGYASVIQAEAIDWVADALPVTKAFEQFILRHRKYCEIPTLEGAPCLKTPTHLLQMRGRRGVMYTIAACVEHAIYAEKTGKVLNAL